MHEFTHTPGVYSPGTKDYAYGYAASVALDSSQAVNNADTYALYANGELFFSPVASFLTLRTPLPLLPRRERERENWVITDERKKSARRC